MVTVPSHCGVYSYQTSGVLTELPHGSGMELPEGVAQIVVPHTGTPGVRVIEFGQRSFAGVEPVCCALMVNQPEAPDAPDTRSQYVWPARAVNEMAERRPQASLLQAPGETRVNAPQPPE